MRQEPQHEREEWGPGLRENSCPVRLKARSRPTALKVKLRLYYIHNVEPSQNTLPRLQWGRPAAFDVFAHATMKGPNATCYY